MEGVVAGEEGQRTGGVDEEHHAQEQPRRHERYQSNADSTLCSIIMIIIMFVT